MRQVHLVLLALFAVAATPLAQKLKPEELVARHVDQALSATDRAIRDREARGTCALTTTIMGAGRIDGPFTLASTGATSRFDLRFDREVYESESVTFDGKEVDVGFAQPRASMRSALGLFLSLNRVIIREGLLGGVLNARWAFFDLPARQAKLSYEGVKKFAGLDLHRLRYRARRDQGDLSILLYLDPETARHVATVYQSSRAQGLGATMESSSQQADQHFVLEERFSDFAAEGALTVPKTWVLRYARTGNTTTEWTYECKVRSIAAMAPPSND